MDDFDAPALAPLREIFMDGAYFIYGHVMMARALERGYQSAWANAHLPTRRERNDFYTRAGRLIPPGRPGLTLLQRLNQTLSPNKIIDKLKEQ